MAQQGPRLELRQSQTLSMTPQLQQAIKLLQMSNLELNDYLEEQLEVNPLLERQSADDATALDRDDPLKSDAEADYHDLQAQREKEKERHDDLRQNQEEFKGNEAPLASEGDLDTEYDNNWTNSSESDLKDPSVHETRDQSMNSISGTGGSMTFDSPEYSLENRISDEADLFSALEDQVRLHFADNQDRALAAVFIDHLDEAGYLNCDLNRMSKDTGISLQKLNSVLKTLQAFEPTGIFARSLQECFALQLEEKGRMDPMMKRFLDNLEMLERHDFAGLRKTVGCDEEDMTDMLSEIRRLNPKPATVFDQLISQTMIPDAIMKPIPKSEGGGWSVQLNNETLPRVLVNKTYYAEIKSVAKDKDSKDFVNEHWQNANWLVKAMDQRAQTILKVAQEIIKKQDLFFVYGVEYLKPLVLRDVAEAIGMHESTVSRVTTNKFMATPRGVFELKYFFTSSINSSDGAIDYSSEAVKAKIKGLIDHEDPNKILSDAKIVKALQADGVEIARRTVVKYREQMGYGSSVDRRRAKNPRL
tara:strand:+ start:2359 stop:3951 length:1593 start_codon:yes stop_codon:yes gene_type:complete